VSTEKITPPAPIPYDPSKHRARPPQPIARSAPDQFRAAIAAFAQFIRNGGRRVTKATWIKRLDVCRQCPERGRLIGRDVCKLCGCFLRLKAWLPAERCPIGQWENGPGRCCGK